MSTTTLRKSDETYQPGIQDFVPMVAQTINPKLKKRKPGEKSHEEKAIEEVYEMLGAKTFREYVTRRKQGHKATIILAFHKDLEEEAPNEESNLLFSIAKSELDERFDMEEYYEKIFRD